MKDYWAEGDTEADRADTTTKGTVVYHYPSGRKERVTAMKNRPFRNHNPANLWYGTEGNAQNPGALTVDEDGFGVFRDWLTGKEAADAWWDKAKASGWTIDRAVHTFIGDNEKERKQRIKDLLDKAKGYIDKDGKPVNRDTPLSRLRDDQFITLRNYNNVQLEGWLNNLDTVQIEIVPAPDTKKGQTGTGPQQAPAGKVPAGPIRNHSYLHLPDARHPLASASEGTPGAFGFAPTASASRNWLLPSDTLQNGPATWASRPSLYSSGYGSAGRGALVSPGRATPASVTTPSYGTLPSPFLSRPRNFLESQPLEAAYRGAHFAVSPPPQHVAAAATAPAKFHSLRDTLDFLGEVYALAKPVSDATGLSLPFILAHASHETGWGRRVRGNNLFNLKADEGWQGPTIAGDGGKTYRAYPSREESMKDYLAYL